MSTYSNAPLISGTSGDTFGTVQLSSGIATVSTTAVSLSKVIMVSYSIQTSYTSGGGLYINNITAGVSFRINDILGGSDFVSWWIVG